MRKTLYICLLIIVIVLFLSFSLKEKNPLKEFFSEEEITYMKNNNISYEDVKKYLPYQNFNIYDYYEYESLLNETDTYLEAINMVYNNNYYKAYEQTEKAKIFDNIILVNKHYYLSKDYTPNNLVSLSNYNIDYIHRENENMLLDKEALDNYQELFDDAKEENINLTIFSAFRSYKKQEYLYYEVCKENDSYSARPGHSEHQTGFAIDISCRDIGLIEAFAFSDAYMWLKDNAYKYGFIERYPQDKENITLYAFEPWHYRYVGKSIASFIYNHNLTLEEYIIKNYEL